MAGVKISELPPLEYPEPEDLLVIVHNDGTEDNTMRTTVQQVLDILTPFSIKSFSVTPSVAPMGSTISSVMLSWTTSKKPTALSVNSTAVPITDTSLIITEDITDTRVFTLSASFKDQTQTRIASIQFSNYIYYGVSPLATYTEADILALTAEMSNTNDKDVVYDCTGGNYFVFAYPKRYGELTSQTKVNSFPWNDWVRTEVSITNPLGFAEDYYVHRSFNLLNGNNIPVNWR